MFAQKMGILRNIPVIEVGEPEIKKNTEYQAEIKNYCVFAIADITNLSLHLWLHNNGPEWFYEQV